jgi:hypothetical protein
MAGMTDYTGVSVEDVIPHIADWRQETVKVIEALRAYKSQVENNAPSFDAPRAILLYLDYFMDLFQRYAGDFARLEVELPVSVEQCHVATLANLYKSACHEEDYCDDFKRKHIERELRDESRRPILDRIYQDTKGMLVDYWDLSNLVPRLECLVGSPRNTGQSGGEMIDALELKPNVLGLGLNLNFVLRRVWNWAKSKRKLAEPAASRDGQKRFPPERHDVRRCR